MECGGLYVLLEEGSVKNFKGDGRKRKVDGLKWRLKDDQPPAEKQS